MMNEIPIYIQIFIYTVFISFIIRTIRNVFYQAFLWQLKEYRVDRLIAHLKTDQGRKLIFGPMTIVKWILLLIIIGDIFFLTNNSVFPYYIFGGLWIIEAAENIKELITRGWKVPDLTAKALIIIGTVFIIELFPFRHFDVLVQIYTGPLLDKLLAPAVAFFVILINIPSLIIKKLIIMMAKRKISDYQNLIVIGITGSYGKTSTKEFLAQILSAKYKLLKTEGSINTEIGIANTILSKLNKSHEIFIVEMGAYKKGEIAAICRMVKPQIGIITGINHQHVALFGSIEETMKTKYELIRNLKINGKVVFNTGNSYVKQMWFLTKEERPDLTRITYQHYKKDDKESNLSASDIKTQPDKLSFMMNFRKTAINCETTLAGAQNVDNILAAAAVSFELGLSAGQIQQAVKSLKAPGKTMKLTGKKNKLILIDDSFNANPDGVLSALKYLQLYKGKKILVLTPLIELGKEAEQIHENIGKKAILIADLILLTNSNFNRSFLKGASFLSANSDKVKIVSYSSATDIIERNSRKEGIVIFEGKEAGKILEKLLSDKINV